MIDPHALRTLIEQKIAEWCDIQEGEHDSRWDDGYESGLLHCANELEAVLSALPETQEWNATTVDGSTITVTLPSGLAVTALTDNKGNTYTMTVEHSAPPPPSEEKEA